MYYGKVEICGVNTASLITLTEDEKLELLAKARSGDEMSRSKLISGNLRLVLSIIKRFSARGENLDDLFQVGCIGLIKAVDNFDTSVGVRFSTYAVPMNILCGNNARIFTICSKYPLRHALLQFFQYIHEPGFAFR